MSPSIRSSRTIPRVEVTGLSGSAFVDPEVAAQADQLLDTHGVVIYRGANIGDDDLLAFSGLLGPVHAFEGSKESEYAGLSIVSRDPQLSRAAPVQYGTFMWHVDGKMDENPHRITLLTCVEPADDGSGDTEFVDTYAAYDELSEDEKAELAGLRVRYSYLNRAPPEEDGGNPRSRSGVEPTVTSGTPAPVDPPHRPHVDAPRCASRRGGRLATRQRRSTPRAAARPGDPAALHGAPPLGAWRSRALG